MLFNEKPKVAGAGENTITIKMPVGAIVKHIACRNETKAWQNISIELSEDGTRHHRYFSLTGLRPQPGDRDLVYNKPFRIDAPFQYVLGTIQGCDASDALWLVVGYEMPARPKHGWGR